MESMATANGLNSSTSRIHTASAYLNQATQRFCASQRNCLIAFITRDHMSFWTTMEILDGFIALVGIAIALIGFIKKT